MQVFDENQLTISFKVHIETPTHEKQTTLCGLMKTVYTIPAGSKVPQYAHRIEGTTKYSMCQECLNHEKYPMMVLANLDKPTERYLLTITLQRVMDVQGYVRIPGELLGWEDE